MTMRRPAAVAASDARFGRWRPSALPLAISWLIAAQALAEAPAFLVRDIHPGPGGSFPGTVDTQLEGPRFLADLNGTLLFRAGRRAARDR